MLARETALVAIERLGATVIFKAAVALELGVSWPVRPLFSMIPFAPSCCGYTIARIDYLAKLHFLSVWEQRIGSFRRNQEYRNTGLRSCHHRPRALSSKLVSAHASRKTTIGDTEATEVTSCMSEP